MIQRSKSLLLRKIAFAAVGVSLLSTAACQPITSYAGFQAIEENPKDIKVGTDTKSTVRARLGSPSATSTFDPNVWYYIAQTNQRVSFRKPQAVARNITAVTFNKETEAVEHVDNVTLKDGKVLAFNGRETPTRGREMTILEQLLGNVGRGTMLPNEDERAPGGGPR